MDKKFADWEVEKYVLIKSADQETLNSSLSEEAFEDVIDEAKKTGNLAYVAHAERIEFLTSNGHEVTRENMLKHDLAALRSPEFKQEQIQEAETAEANRVAVEEFQKAYDASVAEEAQRIVDEQLTGDVIPIQPAPEDVINSNHKENQ